MVEAAENGHGDDASVFWKLMAVSGERTSISRRAELRFAAKG